MNVKVLSHSFRGSVNTLEPFPYCHRAANASPMLEIANPVKTIASCILPFMSKVTAIYA